MADWRKLAKEVLLADSVIDEAEVRILKKELYADKTIDKKEVEFLIELRNDAQKRAKGASLSPAFESFFFKAIQDNVMADGAIDDREVTWLRKMLFADGKIDDAEKKFLQRLKRAAKTPNAKFDKLCAECL